MTIWGWQLLFSWDKGMIWWWSHVIYVIITRQQCFKILSHMNKLQCWQNIAPLITSHSFVFLFTLSLTWSIKAQNKSRKRLGCLHERSSHPSVIIAFFFCFLLKIIMTLSCDNDINNLWSQENRWNWTGYHGNNEEMICLTRCCLGLL